VERSACAPFSSPNHRLYFPMKKIIASLILLTCGLPLFGQSADFGEMSGMDQQSMSKEELIKTWGWLLADSNKLDDFDFNQAELDYIFEGIRGRVQGDQAPVDIQVAISQMQRYFADRAARTLQRRKAENEAKELDFFDSLFGQPGVQSLGTGLHFTIIEPGNDVHPKKTDTVTVHYEGRFLDNKVFDSSAGGQPATFKLNEVIAGWTQGLPLIGEGGKIKLYVPSKLAYGEEGSSGVPPAATLVFEIPNTLPSGAYAMWIFPKNGKT